MNNIKTWKEGEFLAQKYLRAKKYKILSKNFKIAGSEIDIIAKLPKKYEIKAQKLKFKQNLLTKNSYLVAKKQAKDVYVFVEVKARSSEKFGLPQMAVDNKKIMHIKRGAEAYISKHNLENCDVRFDVIAITDGQVEHIENAF